MVNFFLHTLGDSTIDNIYWTYGKVLSEAQGEKDSVEGQICEKMAAAGLACTLVPHAYDGFTTDSVLFGDHVGRVLGINAGNNLSKGKKSYLKNRKIAPQANSYFVKPLDELEDACTSTPGPHYVLLSVGGNDFRVRLRNPWNMLQAIPQIHQNYQEIVRKLKELSAYNVRPILMFQYRLDANHDHYKINFLFKWMGRVAVTIHTLAISIISITIVRALVGRINNSSLAIFLILGGILLKIGSVVAPVKILKDALLGRSIGMATLGYLMERFYTPIIELAKQENIPILDLPNTFDPNDDLYISQIEPNKEAGALISEGVVHIIQNHDFTSEPSIFYSKQKDEESYTGTVNLGSGHWQVRYPE